MIYTQVSPQPNAANLGQRGRLAALVPVRGMEFVPGIYNGRSRLLRGTVYLIAGSKIGLQFRDGRKPACRPRQVQFLSR